VIKWYIGYISGPKYEMYPDIFTADCRGMNHYVGKPEGWGSYVMVAGPYDSEREANQAVKASYPRKLSSYFGNPGDK
jgi:hypothetical protein